MSAGSRKGALGFGLILMAIGLVFFLANWYSVAAAWGLLARYWPVFPILIGLKNLYGYISWQREPAEAADPGGRSKRRYRPTLLGSLLWLGLGTLFLFRNFGIGPDFWALARRYWPLLLILLGMGKVIDYFRQKPGVSFRVGELFGLFFILIIGSAVSRIPDSAWGDLWLCPITIGGTNVNLGKSFGYTQETAYPLSPGLGIRIENTHGQVTVSPGSEREVRVRLRKAIFEEDEPRAKEIAGEIRIEGGEEGRAEASVFVIRTNREELASRNYRFDTDLEVFVPKQVALEIRNPFGGVIVSGLEGPLKVQCTHQALEVRDSSGSFTLANRYGDTRLIGLTGAVSVEARGRVSLSDIKGDVEVRNEYEPVILNNIEGKATVFNTEGSVTLDRVTKPVAIDASGSQVTASRLGDSLRISGSHKRIQATDVDGSVSLTCSYATAALRNIKGNVDISSNSDRISLDDIGGYIKAVAQGSSLRTHTVAGPVDITTTLRDVVVNGFAKGCRVSNDRGDVTLSTDTPGGGDIDVKNRNGDITLLLPPSAGFSIDARARNGHITNEFAGLNPFTDTGDAAVLRGKVSTGGPRISLETENHDIYIRARAVERESPKKGARAVERESPKHR